MFRVPSSEFRVPSYQVLSSSRSGNHSGPEPVRTVLSTQQGLWHHLTGQMKLGCREIKMIRLIHPPPMFDLEDSFKEALSIRPPPSTFGSN